MKNPNLAITGVHPAAEVFPMLGHDGLAVLAADIKTNGLRQPIVLDPDGLVLDGRNRLAACELAGVETAFTRYVGADPELYVISANVHRRNMSPGARAMTTALVLNSIGKRRDGRWLRGSVPDTPGSGSKRWANLMSMAGVVVDAGDPLMIEAVMTGHPLEYAVDDVRRREAGGDVGEAEAIAESGDATPTTRNDVPDETAKPPARRLQSNEHPARFSEAVMEASVELLEPLGVRRILDPFAGTGLAHAVADRLGAESVGVEIEHEWAGKHERTICADSLTITRKMVGHFDGITTSPPWGNRMADHHEARDESDRPTYRHRLGRPLTEGNGGGLQWGEEYRDFHLAVWRRVVQLLEPGGAFVLDIKDHIKDSRRVAVSAWHLTTLLGLGLVYIDDNPVVTAGLGNVGANAKARVRVEHVYLFTKPLSGA